MKHVIRNALCLVISALFWITPVGAEGTKSIDAICWEMIEKAANNVWKPTNPIDEDALQKAYLSTFAVCLKNGVGHIKDYERFIVKSMKNFRYAVHVGESTAEIGKTFERLQEDLYDQVDSHIFGRDASQAVEILSDEVAAAHLAVALAAPITEKQARIYLSYLTGIPVSEIAKEAGVSEDAIYKSIKAAEGKLADVFRKYDRYWTFDRVNSVGVVAVKVLLTILVIILGVMTILEVRDFVGSKFETEVDTYDPEKMRQHVKVAKEKSVINARINGD